MTPDYPALIATIQPAAWWSERGYRAEIDAIRPPETRAEYGAMIHWDNAVRAAMARFRANETAPLETAELDFGETK